MNKARCYAACIFNENDGIIYVFGGDDDGSGGSIEIYDTVNSDKFEYLGGVHLEWDYHHSKYITAFMQKNSNTIFIFGGYTGDAPKCNAFTISTREIAGCPAISATLSAEYHCGALIQTETFTRYYTFGIAKSNENSTNLIIYSTINTKSMSFEPSTNVVFTGQSVPINVEYDGPNTILLICDELNLLGKT
eukprot:402769_1